MYDDNRIHLPTIDECVRALDWPTERWRGQCYGVATALVDAKLITGRAVYGHYYGPIARTSKPFGARAGTNFPGHHGWIVTEDEQIIDPTRWVFEDREPYLYYLDPCRCGDFDDSMDENADEWIDGICYCGHITEEHRGHGFFRPCKFNGDDYDEGCQRWLEDNGKPPPVDDPTIEHKFVLPIIGDARLVVTQLLNLDSAAYLDPCSLPLTIDQAMWLAHLPVIGLGGAARSIYEAMEASGAGAFIPIDSRKLIFPDTY